MYITHYPVVLILTFLWIGFVCAISFMEAGLKFRAPGITLPLGLGIGQLVFNALNKVEWVMAVGIVLNLLLYNFGVLNSIAYLLVTIALLILITQTFWALPALRRRAVQIIDGAKLPPSKLHIYYVALETVKITALFVFGMRLFT